MNMSSQFRKQRRHKARNKAYTPREVRTPMIVGSELVMQPLEAIFDQLERDGTVHTDQKGVPVFQAGDGIWYDAAEAIEGVIWHFEMISTRTGKDLPLDGLRELVIAFRYVQPVLDSTMQKLRESLPVLRRVLALGDPDEQASLLTQTMIRAEFEKQGVSA